MLAINIYSHLENDFIKSELTDNWIKYMTKMDTYICDNFKKRSMGLVCDFTETVNNVYTAVFPSENVIKKLIDNNVSKAMLFLHHPMIWDIRRRDTFYLVDISYIEALRGKHISLYCLHIPLDNYSGYSTSKTLADALEIDIIKPFALESGAYCGVIGKTKCSNINELQEKYTNILRHKTKLYQYGNKEILNNTVGICSGGGNQGFVVNELVNQNINTLVTGISIKNDHSRKIHEKEEINQINVLGGTHYSTEKFTCIKMCEYFSKLGIKAEFIEDEPCFEDM